MMNSPDRKEPMEEPTISLCMMVKDEEEMLPRCLSSVKAYVDEIVVVDTGSTDKTVDIAKSFGAKVFHHPWEDDFSKHRNQSIHHATGDWFLILDADEEIVEGTGSLIRDAVKKTDVDSISFNVISLYAGKKKSLLTQERLFRNRMGIHYEGRIHNRIVGSKTTCLSPIKVLHHGYNVHEERAKLKHERRIRLLNLEIQDNPQNPVAHHYLAASFASVPDYEMAAREALCALELADKRGEAESFFYAWTHSIASSALYHLGRLEDAQQICLLGLKRFPEDPDIRFNACQIAFDCQDVDGLTQHAAVFLDLWAQKSIRPEMKSMTQWVTYDQAWRVAWFLAMNHPRVGALDDFDCQMAKALEMAPKKSLVHHATGCHLMKAGNLEQARVELDRAFDEDPFDEDIICSQIELCISLNDEGNEVRWWRELLVRFPEKKAKMTKQAEQAMNGGQLAHARNLLEALRTRYPQDESVLRLMVHHGLLSIKQSRFEEARQYLQEAVKADPKNAPARLGLAVALYRQAELELCVSELDYTLQILNMPRQMEIASLENLGSIFAAVGEQLLPKGEPHAALLAYDTALVLKYSLAEVHQGLAKALEATNQFQESLQHLMNALKLSEDPAPVLRQMGDVYTLMGNIPAAEFCYGKSQPSRDPSSHLPPS